MSFDLDEVLQRVGAHQAQNCSFNSESEEAEFHKLTNYLNLEIEFLENDFNAC